jgi:hypothetical protein
MIKVKKGNNSIKVVGIVSSVCLSILLIIITITLLIYFFKIKKDKIILVPSIPNNTNNSNSNSNGYTNINNKTDIIVNNSTSNEIKDLKTTFTVDTKQVEIKGFISDTIIIDEINRGLRSNMLNIMLFSKLEQPVINYEYTIKYPDNTIKYLTSNTDKIKHLLILSLPAETLITETGLSGKSPAGTYTVPYKHSVDLMINAARNIFL